MIGFLLSRTGLKLLAGAAGALAVFLAYQWFTGVLEENTELKLRNAELVAHVEKERASHEETKAVYAAWRASVNARIEQDKISLNQLLEKYRQEKAKANELSKMLSKHDFEHLASRKPGLIERRVNAATRRVFDDLETLTRGFAAGDEQASPAP